MNRLRIQGLAAISSAALLVFSMFMWSRPRPNIEESLSASGLVPVLGSLTRHGLSGIFPAHVPDRLTQIERP